MYPFIAYQFIATWVIKYSETVDFIFSPLQYYCVNKGFMATQNIINSL